MYSCALLGGPSVAGRRDEAAGQLAMRAATSITVRSSRDGPMTWSPTGSPRGEAGGQHHGGQSAHAGQRRPGNLVAVRARLAVDDDAPGVDVGLVVVRDGRGRRDRAQQYVVVGEERGAARGQPGPSLPGRRSGRVPAR